MTSLTHIAVLTVVVPVFVVVAAAITVGRGFFLHNMRKRWRIPAVPTGGVQP